MSNPYQRTPRVEMRFRWARLLRAAVALATVLTVLAGCRSEAELQGRRQVAGDRPLRPEIVGLLELLDHHRRLALARIYDDGHMGSWDALSKRRADDAVNEVRVIWSRLGSLEVALPLEHTEQAVARYNAAVTHYNRDGFVLPQGSPREIIDQVAILNEYRAMMGRRGLFLDRRLCCAAQMHAEAMAAAGAIWHNGPDGTPGSRAAAQGFEGPVSENTAKGFPTPQRVHDGWYNSPGHHRAMLSEDWTAIGVGYALGSFWVQVFGVADVPQMIRRAAGRVGEVPRGSVLVGDRTRRAPGLDPDAVEDSHE